MTNNQSHYSRLDKKNCYAGYDGAYHPTDIGICTYKESLNGVVVDVLEFDIVINEFEIQWH